MLSVTSPAQEAWWLWVDSNHQPRAYETFALPVELHSQRQEASDLTFKTTPLRVDDKLKHVGHLIGA